MSKPLSLAIIWINIIGVFLLSGISFVNIFDFPSIIFVLFMGIGLASYSNGFSNVIKALLMIKYYFREFKCEDENILKALRTLIFSFHIAGIFGTIIGSISILSNYEKVDNILNAFGVATLTIFIALILSEFIYRPILNSLENS